MQIKEVYRAKVLGLAAIVRLDGDESAVTVYYPRRTKLGNALMSNARSEREILANYIRQAHGLPRGEANATSVNFVSVR